MATTTKKQASQTYFQLAEIFKALETAAYVEGIDFGENLTGCFKWFLSPSAAMYLQKRFPNYWKDLEDNSRFSCRPVPWQGHKGLGFDINLNL